MRSLPAAGTSSSKNGQGKRSLEIVDTMIRLYESFQGLLKGHQKHISEANLMSLTVTWQRLTAHGKTCERCRATEEEIEEAAAKLKNSLSSLGITVEVKKEELTEEEFKNNPEASNRIFINGTPLEELLGAATSQSECCDVCGDNECRTVVVNGSEYETIPSDLIVEAGLKAVLNMRGNAKACCSSGSNTSCCDK